MTLDGNQATASAIGKQIASVELADDALRFSFTDGSKLTLRDAGQSCCEKRYMRTDDDLPYFVGATLLGAETRDAPSEDAEYDSHEVEFLVVTTSRGVFTMSSHNEHNGYYGGFYVQATVSP